MHRNIVDAIVSIDQSLDNAARFLDAADALIARGNIGARLEELVELASSKVDEAAIELEAEFGASSDEFDKLTAEARRLLDAEPDETSPETATGEASSHLHSAKVSLAELPKPHEDVKDRVRRLADLTTRRDSLRSRTSRHL